MGEKRKRKTLAIHQLLLSHKHAKIFISLDKEDEGKNTLNLSKREITVFIGLMAGHCPLRYYLQMIGKAEDYLCRF